MHIIDDYEEYSGEEEYAVVEQNTCPRCTGGCGYCLMLER